MDGSTCLFRSVEPDSRIGVSPRPLTVGMSDDAAQTRATSSITRQPASSSAPSPPNSSGIVIAWKPARVSASAASVG